MLRSHRFLVFLVIAHFVTSLVHAVAHVALQIVPAGVDLVFIVVVILAGPVAALPALRVRRTLAAAGIAGLMGASFAYGFYGHFVGPGPDRVSLVWSEPWTAMFVATAAVLGVLEAAAVVVAVRVVISARTPSAPAGRPS